MVKKTTVALAVVCTVSLNCGVSAQDAFDSEVSSCTFFALPRDEASSKKINELQEQLREESVRTPKSVLNTLKKKIRLAEELLHYGQVDEAIPFVATAVEDYQGSKSEIDQPCIRDLVCLVLDANFYGLSLGSSNHFDSLSLIKTANLISEDGLSADSTERRRCQLLICKHEGSSQEFFVKLIESLKFLEAERPTTPEFYLEVSSGFEQLNRYDESIACIRLAIDAAERDNRNALRDGLVTYLGRRYYALGDYKTCALELEKYGRKTQTPDKFFDILWSESCFRGGSRDKGLRLMEQTFSKYFSQSQLPGINSYPDSRQRLARAYSLVGKPDLAIELYRKPALKYPDSSEQRSFWRDNLSRIFMDYDLQQQASQLLSELLQTREKAGWLLDPYTSQLRQRLACALVRCGQERKALALYTTLVSKCAANEADLSFARCQLAAFQAESGAYAQAELEFKKVLNLRKRIYSQNDLHNLNVVYNLAQVLAVQGKKQEAGKCLETLVTAKYGPLPLLLDTYKLAGEFGKAIEICQKVDSKFRDLPWGFYAGFADLYLANKQPKGAANVIAKIKEGNPDLFLEYLVKTGDFTQAQNECETQLEQAQNNPGRQTTEIAVLKALAFMAFSNKEYERAIEYSQKGLQVLKPYGPGSDEIELKGNISLAQERSGKRELSKQTLKELLGSVFQHQRFYEKSDPSNNWTPAEQKIRPPSQTWVGSPFEPADFAKNTQKEFTPIPNPVSTLPQGHDQFDLVLRQDMVVEYPHEKRKDPILKVPYWPQLDIWKTKSVPVSDWCYKTFNYDLDYLKACVLAALAKAEQSEPGNSDKYWQELERTVSCRLIPDLDVDSLSGSRLEDYSSLLATLPRQRLVEELQRQVEAARKKNRATEPALTAIYSF